MINIVDLDQIFIYNSELLTDSQEQIEYYNKIKNKLSTCISNYERIIIFINTLQISIPISITLFESLKQYITLLNQFQMSVIPIVLSSALSLLISFSKYFQFETTLANMNNIDSKYTFIIARLRHKERCILKMKTNNKDEINKMLIEFDIDTFDSYIEQVLNDTDAQFKNIAMEEINTNTIISRQYKNRTDKKFEPIKFSNNDKKKKTILQYIYDKLYINKLKNTSTFEVDATIKPQSIENDTINNSS